MIIVMTARRIIGYLGQLAYALLIHDKTKADQRVLHIDDNGRFAFRLDCDVSYVDTYGIAADAGQWVTNCLRLKHLYGAGQRDKTVYTHTFTLTWHPADDITAEQALVTAHDFAAKYLRGFGVLYIQHFDTANKHVHIVISAWRDRDIDVELPWMRRGQDGQVIACDRLAGGKFHCSDAMLESMNEYAYQTSLANGWVAVDVNALVRRRDGERYDAFTARVRRTLLDMAEVSVTWHDFFALIAVRCIRIDMNSEVVSNWDGRWERSFAELNLSIRQLATAIGPERDSNEPDLGPKELILRVACLSCAPTAHTWSELCGQLSELYGLDLRCKDDGSCVISGLRKEANLDELALPEQTMRHIKGLLVAERNKKRAEAIKQLPQKEQLSYLAMLADEVMGTDAVCRELYNQYRSMVSSEETLEQYWRVYFSTVDLFWREYTSHGKGIWESYRADMSEIHSDIQLGMAAMQELKDKSDLMTAGLIVGSIFIHPLLILIAVLLRLIAILLAVRIEQEVEYLLVKRETRKWEYIIERERHKALAQQAAKKDLSLIERYGLLREMEDEDIPVITEELLEDMQAYMQTPTRAQKQAREIEHER